MTQISRYNGVNNYFNPYAKRENQTDYLQPSSTIYEPWINIFPSSFLLEENDHSQEITEIAESIAGIDKEREKHLNNIKKIINPLIEYSLSVYAIENKIFIKTIDNPNKIATILANKYGFMNVKLSQKTKMVEGHKCTCGHIDTFYSTTYKLEITIPLKKLSELDIEKAIKIFNSRQAKTEQPLDEKYKYLFFYKNPFLVNPYR